MFYLTGITSTLSTGISSIRIASTLSSIGIALSSTGTTLSSIVG